ncbi:hypothetical protein DPEC_G00245620 [Dallia pectoralis]|uniref:Uncharacterized protein n=1 Tax=Dallia pectoralis TaxID=75939 RepID=A0ACC2FW65_DALPE|nr:hypothetical protein DPEC_G00245620 [Dallia pectoralis]
MTGTLEKKKARNDDRHLNERLHFNAALLSRLGYREQQTATALVNLQRFVKAPGAAGVNDNMAAHQISSSGLHCRFHMGKGILSRWQPLCHSSGSRTTPTGFGEIRNLEAWEHKITSTVKSVTL